MNRPPRTFLMGGLAALLAASPVQAAFPQPVQQVRLACGQKEVTLNFRSDGTPITRAHPLCDCTTVTIRGSELVARVDTSHFDQNVDKQIDVTTADGKTTRLTMRFEVPPALILSARSLIWRTGAAPTPQTLRIRIPEGSPVHDIAEAALSGDAFDFTPRKVRAGREYTVTITPKSTAHRVLNRLILTTDSPDPRYTREIIYLQVRR